MMSNQTLSIPYITPCWAKYLVIPGNTSIAMFSFAVFTILVFGIFKGKFMQELLLTVNNF